MLTSFRRSFFTGLVVLLPLAVTIWLILFLIDKVGNPASRFILQFVQIPIRNEFLLETLATLVVITLITILGFVSKYFFGRILIRWTELIVENLPFVNLVYKTVKQIVTTFAEQKKAVFQETVLIEYPRKGVFVLGFLTSKSKGEVQSKTEANLLNVFVPTTPNPTSGFLLMVPEEEVIRMDMAIPDGMKVIISGGAVVPPYLPNGKPVEGAVQVENPTEMKSS